MYETLSWHTYRYAFGFVLKTGCDNWGGRRTVLSYKLSPPPSLSLSQRIYLFTRHEPSGAQVNSATSGRRLEGWAWRLFGADWTEEEVRKLHFDSRQLKRSRGWCLQYWKADSWHSSTLLQSLILCKFTYGLYRTVGVALRWSHTLNL